ncbi:MAG: hypothetical protein B6I24_10150 [Bacteroidetes bacterium 4572_128]|nr:MAG: hypothetical protein B6I24_10150 [Bacteroidetes bacterium 4572_128]
MNFKVYIYILIGISLFALFKGIRILLSFLPINKKKLQRLKNYLPAIHLLFWIIYIVFGIEFLLDTNYFYPLGIFFMAIIMAIWFSWFAVKDFIAGLIFKMEGDFFLNEIIKLEKYEGKILDFGYRNLKIETETNEIIYIPYSICLNKIVIKPNLLKNIATHNLTIKVKNEISVSDKIKEIKLSILTLPWVSIKKSPKIKMLKKLENFTIFELIIFVHEKKYFYKIESFLKKKFEV